MGGAVGEGQNETAWTPTGSPSLDAVLREARRRGFLGPSPIEDHRSHAERFGEALDGQPFSRALDLGSGGGLPGMVLAGRFPASQWVLLDYGERRTTFLASAVTWLKWTDRIEVWRGRAEDVAQDPSARGSFDLVVARGFGPPAVTAECATGFLRVGGLLAVSEPPGSTGERWPGSGLATLGLRLESVVAGIALLRQLEPCPDTYPRRVGRPSKRPLF